MRVGDRRAGRIVGAALILAAISLGAYQGAPPLLVVDGGTGATTLTAHGVLFGEGTSAIVASSTGTTGVPLIGQGAAADPIFGTAVVAGGGTGATTLTAHGVLVGEGTSTVVATATGTASQVLTSGGSSADPSFANLSTLLTAGTGISLSGTTNVTITATGGSGVALSTATATGASPITLAATNGLTTIVSMATPAASTINLPTAVQTAGWRQCVKDGTTNFTTNNATVKSPTSGTIDGTAGATGVVMNQAHQELCFISDGTNWFIE